MDIIDYILIGVLILAILGSLFFILIPAIGIIPVIGIILSASILVYRNTWVTFSKVIILIYSFILLIITLILIYTKDKDIYDISQSIKNKKSQLEKKYVNFKTEAQATLDRLEQFPNRE